MNSQSLTLTDSIGNPVAELHVSGEQDGWFSGQVVSSQLPPKLQEAVDWYDDVVENQMLGFLDQAADAIERYGLAVRASNGALHKVYSLHITKRGEVSYRTSPVPPPMWLAKSQSA